MAAGLKQGVCLKKIKGKVILEWRSKLCENIIQAFTFQACR